MPETQAFKIGGHGVAYSGNGFVPVGGPPIADAPPAEPEPEVVLESTLRYEVGTDAFVEPEAESEGPGEVEVEVEVEVEEADAP